MQISFENPETRTWLTGAAVAAVAGVLIGAALKPDFGDDRVLGPQFVATDGSLHAARYTPDPGVSVYGGKVPDYVIGTDWTRPPRQVAEAPPAADRSDAVVFTADDEPAAEPPMVTHATWREAPRAPSSYPSLDGDRRYGDEPRGDDGRDRGWPDGDRYGPADEDQPD